MKYTLIDISNLVHRSKHVIRQYDSFDECVALVLTITFFSIKKSYDKFGADHCVACFDSYSWRKELFDFYKLKDKSEYTEEKIEEDKIIKEVIKHLHEFFYNNTNVTVLKEHGIEADDFIARWVQRHNDPENHSHIIISADSDFKQLVSENVELFNPLINTIYTIDGVYYQDGKMPKKHDETINKYGETWKVKYKKKKQTVPMIDEYGVEVRDEKGKVLTEKVDTYEREVFDPQWELFYKCIRGDISDKIPSAYPRVQTKKLREAYEDKGGLKWNNLINSYWGEDNEKSVRELYERNKMLIDLSAQPSEIVELIDEVIDLALEKEVKKLVAVYFAKFCSKYRLPKLQQQAQIISRMLSATYKGS